MAEFKDKIRAAGGKLEYLFQPDGRLAFRISGNSSSGMRAMYMVAVSMDGSHFVDEVPAVGIGGTAVYRQPSVVAYVQSDEQGMWGRNCPACERYFRTTHIFHDSVCPYCAKSAPSLTFISKAQRMYIAASYDAFARAMLTHEDTSLSLDDVTDKAPNQDDVTDKTPAWHYSEEKQQTHFKCKTDGCGVETDILGIYGFCPRCGRTNARVAFSDVIDRMLARWAEAEKAVTDREQRAEVWADLTVKSVTEFETLAKHLRRKLLISPMTPKRREELEALNFQSPLEADVSLRQWFDIGIVQWSGNAASAPRALKDTELPFITKMLQRRHILIHNSGVVDEGYLKLSGDTQARLHERIRIPSKECRHFVELVREMGLNLLDGVELGIVEAK
jgi:hypothetical protein